MLLEQKPYNPAMQRIGEKGRFASGSIRRWT